MPGPRRGAFVGNSKTSFEDALKKAYEDGMKGKPKGGGRKFTFRVVDIRVEGENPPTDYTVELDDD